MQPRVSRFPLPEASRKGPGIPNKRTQVVAPGQPLQARLRPAPPKDPVLYTHPAPWSCAPRSRAAWSRVKGHSSGGGAGAGRRREQAHNAEHPWSQATAPPIVPRHPARGCQPVPPAAAPERAPAATGTGEPSGAPSGAGLPSQGRSITVRGSGGAGKGRSSAGAAAA